MQGDDFPNVERNRKIFRRITEEKTEALKVQVENVEKSLPSDTLSVIEEICQPGNSNWLRFLPLSFVITI